MARSSHQTYLKHLLWNSPDVGRHGWVPAADVYDLHHGWMIKVELAGIRPQDVSVTLDGDVLRVVGRRRDWVAHETRGCRSLEISYQRFAQLRPGQCARRFADHQRISGRHAAHQGDPPVNDFTEMIPR